MIRVNLKTSYLLLFGAIVTYTLFAKIVFDKIYLTSKNVVDEEFHLPLGEAYCKLEFDKWHPKVTTFPGLYLFSTLILGSLQLCTTYFLRYTSFVSSVVNIILFYYLFKINNREPSWKNILSAINLSLLPPLYFFSNLYYTDVPSITMILFMFLYAKKDYHYASSVFGFFSVLFRQTNIIWVGMVCGNYVLKELNSANPKRARSFRQEVTSQDFVNLIFKGDLWFTLRRLSFHFWLNVACYGSVFFFFLAFVYVNGSIVVGDKTAHEATVHLNQIFYFSLFCLIFAWPYFIGEIGNFMKFVMKHKLLTLVAVVIILVIIRYNFLVHPYLLADNRHYVFYIWNRFYGKYSLFRYFMIPVYLFSLFVIISKLGNRRDVTFLSFFIPCTLVVLVTQRLVEFRYFFIPYILFRTNLKNVPLHSQLYEFSANLILNVCTLYLFFTKTIHWDDFDEPQRLIW